MIVKLLTEHHLEFLSLKGGCRSSSESTLVKMSNCWKSHVMAHFSNSNNRRMAFAHAGTLQSFMQWIDKYLVAFKDFDYTVP